MKKNKTIEMRIYELLGIKFFRKMAFGLHDILKFPLTIKMSNEERHDFLHNRASNYNLGKINSLEEVKKFKKHLFINSGIHIWALLFCLPNFLKVIGGTASLSTSIINLTCIDINLYCIMLQRYNGIRINQLIKKMTSRYDKQKEAIKEELRKEEPLLLNHTYKIESDKKKYIETIEEQMYKKESEKFQKAKAKVLVLKATNIRK